MHCPDCGHPELRVLTGNADQHFRLRHRRCTGCGATHRTIEALADGVVVYRTPLGSPSGRGSRLAVIATRVSWVRHLLAQLNDPPAPQPR